MNSENDKNCIGLRNIKIGNNHGKIGVLTCIERIFITYSFYQFMFKT